MSEDGFIGAGLLQRQSDGQWVLVPRELLGTGCNQLFISQRSLMHPFDFCEQPAQHCFGSQPYELLQDSEVNKWDSQNFNERTGRVSLIALRRKVSVSLVVPVKFAEAFVATDCSGFAVDIETNTSVALQVANLGKVISRICHLLTDHRQVGGEFSAELVCNGLVEASVTVFINGNQAKTMRLDDKDVLVIDCSFVVRVILLRRWSAEGKSSPLCPVVGSTAASTTTAGVAAGVLVLLIVVSGAATWCIVVGLLKTKSSNSPHCRGDTGKSLRRIYQRIP